MIEKLNLKWILLIGFVVHLPMLRNGFTYYSDDTYVLNNILIHEINSETLKALFTTYFDGHYHPLTLLSLGITYLFSGTNPLGYQVTNLLFHLLSCLVIYKILTRLDLRKNIVNLSTLIFAIHPLNVESVARITERKDTQYVLFLLIAVYYFFEFCREPDKRKLYFISVFSFILALLSKGQAIVFPVILYVISFYQYKTSGVKIKHAFIAPLFLFSVLFAWLNLKAQVVTGYISETETVSLQQAITYPSYIITHYISKLLLPFNLSAQYPKPEVNFVFLIFPIIILVLIFIVYRLNRNKNYIATLGVLLYVVSVFPMLRIIPVSENFMPDRYNYLGILGFGLFISAMYYKFNEKFIKYNPPYLLTAWLLVLCVLCFTRTTKWKDGLTVWEDAHSKFPDDEFASINYAGNLTSTKKDISKGLQLYQQSIAKNPDQIINKIYYAEVLSSLGRKEESLAIIKEIINSKPVSATNIANRASILLAYGRAAESGPEFNKAVYLKPQFAKNRIKKAGYYFNQFQFEQALSEIDTLEDLHSNYLDVIYMMRTELYINQNNPRQAQEALTQAKKIGCDIKKVKELQTKISNLTYLNPQEADKMNQEQKISYGKKLYSNGLYYHSYQVFLDLLKQEPDNEQVINFSITCAFKLSRPDLMKMHLEDLKKMNRPLNPDAVKYLSSLALEV